jgi:YD repeat-containing protein
MASPSLPTNEEAMHSCSLRFRVVLLCWLSLALLGGSLRSAAQDSIALEPVDEIVQDTKTEIKFTLKTKPVDAPTPRFSIATLRKSDKETAAPKNLLLNAETGAVTWTPTPSQAGLWEITFAVKDGKNNEATGTVKLVVRERAIANGNGQIVDLLRKWHVEGTAAGNTGDFYDNRDGDHSPLNLNPWPQLDQVIYTPEDIKARRHWAAQQVILPHVTFGNSSTSAPVTNSGSNIRFYYTHPRGMAFLYQEYRSNNLYMYPAHHDHHPGRNGKPFYGDVYPANSPYLIASQGSSGSDQPFMRAVPYTLAAFRPEVKRKLIESGLLMPTVQMIFRSTNKHLTDPKEYLTGKAHPPVFEGSWVNDQKMVQLAHDIELKSIPPLAMLKVVEEDKPTAGKDYFEAGLTEVLHDTPCAIARVVRGGNQVRRIVVSAEESFDVNKQPLKYHWVVLRGDAERIKIKPLNEAGSQVEILVPYHERRLADGHHLKIESNRVDIGAFVYNGTYYSPPAFVTFHSLDSEARTYDDQGKLLEIGYGCGDADLVVQDWNAFFGVLRSEEKTLAAQLLQKQFKADERTAILKAADEYKSATTQLTAAQDKGKQTGEVRQQAIEALKKADLKLAETQKANEKDPGDETLKAFKLAGLEQQTASEERKRTESEYQAAQKELEAARKSTDAVLTQKRDGLEAPVRTLLESALNRLKENPSFYLEQREALDKLLQSADASRQARINNARKRLVGMGVLKQDGDANQLVSIRGGDKPVTQRLTRYEKHLIERFNAEVLAALLYPGTVNHAFKSNLVDMRLTTPRGWRDVYRYDAKGALLGWTRYDGEKPAEFTADGMLVLEKDAKGRAVKAQTVKYVIDDPTKPLWGGAGRSLKQQPGNEIVHYEYAGDDDFQGKIGKREPVDEKK